jgi:hypothetical protein
VVYKGDAIIHLAKEKPQLWDHFLRTLPWKSFCSPLYLTA